MANQLRGLLKLFGLRLGKTTAPARWVERPAALFAQQPGLRPVLAPLVAALAALEEQIGASSRGLKARAEADPVAARLMTVPGVGPITALSFKSCIENPFRFAHSADAGAYAGIVPRRFQSGECETRGTSPRPAIRCCARPPLRGRQQPPGKGRAALRPAALGQGAGPGQGPERARVAVARKLAILPHRLWLPDTSFQWT